MRTLLVLCALLWAWPAWAGPETPLPFDTDFETCSVGSGNDFPCEGWDDFGQESVGHLEVTDTLSFSGSKSVKGTHDSPTENTQTPSIFHSWAKRDHIFARTAVRFSSGFQYCTFNGFTKLFKFKDDGGYPTLWVEDYFGKYAIVMEGSFADGTFVIDTGISVNTSSWDQLEIELKLNDPGQSNSIIRLWINGTLRIEQLNHQHRGPTPTSIGASGVSNPSTMKWRTAQIYIQCGLGNDYFDRFAVGDTRIGLVGGAPPPPTDTQAPATPTGLMVR
jgi:hypothetical protein